jgi:hypothetical protein
VIRVGGTEVRVEDGKVFVDGKEQAGGKVEVDSRGRKIVVEGGQVTIDGKPLTGRAAHPVVVVKKIDATESGDGTRREEVRVQVIRSGDGREVAPLPPVPPAPFLPPGAAHAPLGPIPPMPPLPPMPGLETLRFESTARLGKGVTTSLGAKDFGGVRAEGKSTVWTIAAGEIGNRNPIQIASETWFAPDLQVTVSSRYSDPRTGESTYRLANIQRGEPAAELFRVPAEYSLRESGARR